MAIKSDVKAMRGRTARYPKRLSQGLVKNRMSEKKVKERT